jgi:hypothetical protein
MTVIIIIMMIIMIITRAHCHSHSHHEWARSAIGKPMVATAFFGLWLIRPKVLVESPPVLANGGVENGAREGRGPRSAQRTCRK